MKTYTSIQSSTVQYIQLNAFKVLSRKDFILDNFDVIHASPPCQFYSRSTRQHGIEGYADSIAKVRDILMDIGLPYIIENVEDAPLLPKRTIMLCGTMFATHPHTPLRVIRHRKFECSHHLELVAPPHIARDQHPLIYSTDWRKVSSRQSDQLDPATSFVTVAGGCQAPLADCKSAMGISWMTRRQLNQAIPPPYTEWIGKQLIDQLTNK